MKPCNQCGYENVDSSNFCQNCGTNISQVEEVSKLESVITKVVEEKPKKNIYGRILGIVACSVSIPGFQIANIIEVFFKHNAMASDYANCITQLIICTAMIIISSIGLKKSIIKSDLAGKIINPIALGFAIFIMNFAIADLLNLIIK